MAIPKFPAAELVIHSTTAADKRSSEELTQCPAGIIIIHHHRHYHVEQV
jgi:hypothetical protein